MALNFVRKIKDKYDIASFFTRFFIWIIGIFISIVPLCIDCYLQLNTDERFSSIFPLDSSQEIFLYLRELCSSIITNRDFSFVCISLAFLLLIESLFIQHTVKEKFKVCQAILVMVMILQFISYVLSLFNEKVIWGVSIKEINSIIIFTLLFILSVIIHLEMALKGEQK